MSIHPPDLEQLLFFDLETTGLEVDCRIVQIAMLRGERMYQSLVNPEMPIPAESTAIHRITDEDVVDAPTFAEIVDDLAEWLEGCTLAGFNIRRFDVPVMKREYKRVGRTFPALPLLDMFELNQKMNPRTLAWFYEHYSGEPMDSAEAHDAVYDCICTRKGFLGMFEKHFNLPKSLEELIPFAEPDRLPVGDSTWLSWQDNQSEPCFTRGKYRGWVLSDVARKEGSYLDWLGSIDADPTTKNLVRLYKRDRDGYVALLKSEHPFRLEPRYLEFRQAMDKKDMEKFPELMALAEETNDPSLVFLSAAWAVLAKREEAEQLGKAYLEMKDTNVNSKRRIAFIEKSIGGR